MKPAYFDLTVHDVGEARKFFEEIFDWRFERFPMPYEYYRIQAGPEGEAGIDGGIGALKDAPIADGTPVTQLTVPVANLDETIAKVLASGGRVIEPRMPVPGIGWYATCAEPGGLRFGIIEADPTAKCATGQVLPFPIMQQSGEETIMNPTEHITGAEKLVAVLGVWPSFHDAELVSFSAERALPSRIGDTSAHLAVHIRRHVSRGKGTARYEQVLAQSVLVRFAFPGACGLELSDFNDQNVIDAITVTPLPVDEPANLLVTIESIWGFGGSLRCSAVEIESVEMLAGGPP